MKATFIAKLQKTRAGLHRLDFSDKKAPQIKRYQEYNFPEGYNYILVLNQDSEATYKENLEYEKFEKLNFLAPHSG